MSNALHDLFIVQSRINSEEDTWMYGILSRHRFKGVLIYSDQRRQDMPMETPWLLPHELLITFKEHISMMSASTTMHSINLIKSVRASGDTSWMYRVMVALRAANIIEPEISRVWEDSFRLDVPTKPLGPTTILPFPANSFAANTRAADQPSNAQPRTGQSAGRSAAGPITAGVLASHFSTPGKPRPVQSTGNLPPTSQSMTIEMAAESSSASVRLIQAKPTLPSVTESMSISAPSVTHASPPRQRPGPQSTAGQCIAGQPTPSQSAAGHSTASRPAASQSTTGPSTSTTEPAKSQSKPAPHLLMPRIPMPRSDTRKSSCPGGSGASPGGTSRPSKVSRTDMGRGTGSGTFPATGGTKRTEGPPTKESTAQPPKQGQSPHAKSG